MAADQPGAGSTSAPTTTPPGTNCRLPNGDTIRCLNRQEALFTYREIFEQRVYLRHGIEVRDGDCIFDVGANIGLFTLFVQQLKSSVATFAFEPSPVLCDIIRQNTQHCGARVRLHPCGLSNRAGEARFRFYPNYSILSTFHPDEAAERDMLRVAVRNQFRETFGDAGGLELRHIDALVDDMLAKATDVRCPLRTLSDIIREAGVERIDLLKVDAEKSERAVLEGLGESDWPRIRQVAMEIHDSGDSELPRIRTMLEGHAFAVAVETEPQFHETGVHNLYASRR